MTSPLSKSTARARNLTFCRESNHGATYNASYLSIGSLPVRAWALHSFAPCLLESSLHQAPTCTQTSSHLAGAVATRCRLLQLSIQYPFPFRICLRTRQFVRQSLGRFPCFIAHPDCARGPPSQFHKAAGDGVFLGHSRDPSRAWLFAGGVQRLHWRGLRP